MVADTRPFLPSKCEIELAERVALLARSERITGWRRNMAADIGNKSEQANKVGLSDCLW
jgi:hypothetical protein